MPRGFWKLIALELIALGLTAWMGRWLAGYLHGGIALAWLLPVAGATFIAHAFASVFNPLRPRRIIVALLQIIVFLLAYLSLGGVPLSLASWAAAAVLVFSVWGDEALWAELQNRLRLSFISLAHRKIARALTGYLLAGIILSMPAWQDQPLPIPESQFRSFYESSVRMAGVLFPGVKLDATVGAFAESVIRKQVQGNGGFEALPGDVRDAQIRQAAETMIRDASKNLDIPIEHSMRLADVFYVYLAKSMATWKSRLGGSFTLIWAMCVFIFLRGLGTLLVWAAALAGGLCYGIMIAFGYASVAGESAVREKLMLT